MPNAPLCGAFFMVGLIHQPSAAKSRRKKTGLEGPVFDVDVSNRRRSGGLHQNA